MQVLKNLGNVKYLIRDERVLEAIRDGSASEAIKQEYPIKLFHLKKMHMYHDAASSDKALNLPLYGTKIPPKSFLKIPYTFASGLMAATCTLALLAGVLWGLMFFVFQITFNDLRSIIVIAIASVLLLILLITAITVTVMHFQNRSRKCFNLSLMTRFDKPYPAIYENAFRQTTERMDKKKDFLIRREGAPNILLKPFEYLMLMPPSSQDDEGAYNPWTDPKVLDSKRKALTLPKIVLQKEPEGASKDKTGEKKKTGEKGAIPESPTMEDIMQMKADAARILEEAAQKSALNKERKVAEDLLVQAQKELHKAQDGHVSEEEEATESSASLSADSSWEGGEEEDHDEANKEKKKKRRFRPTKFLNKTRQLAASTFSIFNPNEEGGLNKKKSRSTLSLQGFKQSMLNLSTKKSD